MQRKKHKNVHYTHKYKLEKETEQKPKLVKIIYTQKWHVHAVSVHVAEPDDSLSIYFEMDLHLENAMYTVHNYKCCNNDIFYTCKFV